MASMYLNKLTRSDYDTLKRTLWESQNHHCFLCEKLIDLDLQGDATDIDHIVPIVGGGKDAPQNFAIAHQSCNRSKQASNLEIARLLAKFHQISEKTGGSPGRPHLGDVLQQYGGARYDLRVMADGCKNLRLSFTDIGDQEIRTVRLHRDPLSDHGYFYAVIPVAYLHHDERINPRAIAGTSLRKLVEEFYDGLPQLHSALAWIELDDSGKARLNVFDGQHKAAAQIMLGVKELPLRVFVNPNLEKLLTANTHAGTTLRQVAFDKSVQRHLGSQLLVDRIEQFLKDTNRHPDDMSFSERDLINHFRGQWREVRRYILDDVRDRITHHTNNRLRTYIDFGGRGTERPLSYSTVEKTFYSFFIYGDALDTPFNYQLEAGENPRQLEVDQIVRLMNNIVDMIYADQFDPTIGTRRLERRVQEGKDVIPLEHLRAVRMSKEEILYNWLDFVRDVISSHFMFNSAGVPFNKDKPFQTRFPDSLWENIDKLLDNLKVPSLWVNTALSESVFGGKQTYEWWRTTFQTGKTPAGQQVLARGITLAELLQ